MSSLQRRVKRIESLQKVDERKRHEYAKPGAKVEKRVIVGTRIDDPEIGKKSVWQGRDPDSGVSVETLALEYYADYEGLKGCVISFQMSGNPVLDSDTIAPLSIHSEGSILRTIVPRPSALASCGS